MNTVQITDYMCDLFSRISSPEQVRETSNYQFMLALANKLMEKDPEFSASMANEVATSVDVSLPMDFYNEYPVEFERLVDGFASALVHVHRAMAEDFNDEGFGIFVKSAAKMNIKIEA